MTSDIGPEMREDLRKASEGETGELWVTFRKGMKSEAYEKCQHALARCKALAARGCLSPLPTATFPFEGTTTYKYAITHLGRKVAEDAGEAK